jgi:hypothetical protein
MVLVMYPKVAGMKVESSWGHGRKAVVRCIAYLTRRLTAREADRLRSLVSLEEVDGDRLTWFCRPEEVEPLQERVNLALDRAVRAGRVRSGMRLARRAGFAV